MERLQLKGGERILEVGTGWGNHAYALLTCCSDITYVGIDISQKTLDVASDRLKEFKGRFTLQKDNANALSFADNTFDAVFCGATLHHMEEPITMIKEMVRVIKPGARLVLMEPNWIYPTNIYIAIKNEEDRHMWLMRHRNFDEWMHTVGLRNICVEHLLYTPPQPKRLIKLYDVVDAMCSRIPLVKRCSLMLCGSGEK